MKLANVTCAAVLGGCLVVACGQQDSAVSDRQASASEVARIEGTYQRLEPASAELVLTPQGESWRVSIIAAGIPNGASTAADCRVDAMGPISDGHITATVAAAPPEDGGLPAAPEPAPGALILVVEDEQVSIIEETVSAQVCGLGSDLAGVYRRG